MVTHLIWLQKSTVLTATHSHKSSPSGSLTANPRFPEPEENVLLDFLSVNQSVNQPVSQYVNKPISQSINQPTKSSALVQGFSLRLLLCDVDHKEQYHYNMLSGYFSYHAINCLLLSLPYPDYYITFALNLNKHY